MNARHLSSILLIAAAIGLSADANAAFYDGTNPLYSGSTPFFSSASQLYGYIDYAVYAPGDFTGAGALQDKYYYCYQLFDSSTSAAIQKFTVTLDTGAIAYSPGSFVSSTGDINPNGASFNAPTVTYLFNSRNNNITANHNSSVMFFAGDSSWITDSGNVIGTTTGSVSVLIPDPTPEPASLLLMALAAPALLSIRRRKH